MALLLLGKLLSLCRPEPDYHSLQARTRRIHLLFLFLRFGAAYNKRRRVVLFIAGQRYYSQHVVFSLDPSYSVERGRPSSQGVDILRI